MLRLNFVNLALHKTVAFICRVHLKCTKHVRFNESGLLWHNFVEGFHLYIMWKTIVNTKQKLNVAHRSLCAANQTKLQQNFFKLKQIVT